MSNYDDESAQFVLPLELGRALPGFVWFFPSALSLPGLKKKVPCPRAKNNPVKKLLPFSLLIGTFLTTMPKCWGHLFPRNVTGAVCLVQEDQSEAVRGV